MLKIRSRLVIGVLIAIFFGISLFFRVSLPYDQVFSGDWIKFTSIDAYYHMRLVDNLVHNLPDLTHFDPFFIYPGGSGVGGVHFFDWLLAVTIWVIGLGSPTQHTINVVGVYFPAVLAALAVIPVYFIGKALFNRWAGVMAAGLMALLPGEFLGRSLLGFTDHHVAEVLFSTTAVLFLILAIKDAAQKQLTINHLVKLDREVIVRPLVYSLLAGIFLGIYLITWLGGLLFVFIITLYFILQFIMDHLRQKSSDYLGFAGSVLFLVALIIFLPFSTSRHLSIALIVAFLIPPVLAGISMFMSRRELKKFCYPLTVIGIGILFTAGLYAVAPTTLSTMWANFLSVFAPGGATASTTLEMQPFLSPQGGFSTLVAWGNFTTSFFLIRGWPIPGFGLISFFILIYLFIRKRRDEQTWLLFLTWTLVILVATLSQRRFAYYLVVNMALLSAYLSWQVIWLAGLRKLVASPEKSAGKEHFYPDAPRKHDYYQLLGVDRNASYKEIKKAFRKLSLEHDQNRNPSTEAQENFKEISKAHDVLTNPDKRTNYDQSRNEASGRKKARGHQESRGITINHVNVGLAIIVVFLLVFFWNIGKSDEVASAARFAPSDAWEESLTWMEKNTPDPFGDPDAYYKLYEAGYKYPASAYGVTSWWDYGYWISRTAHRIPSANPSQAPIPITRVANLFLTQEESESYAGMAELESSYVIADYAMSTSKFWAIVTWAGLRQEQFIDVYQLPQEGNLMPIQLYKPDYYRSMLVRLFNFDGKAVTDESPIVVTYENRTDRGGNPYKLITDAQEFPGYREALEYVESQETGNYSIVSADPFVSPIPLEALQNYRLIFSAKKGVSHEKIGLIPEVKVFEYTR